MGSVAADCWASLINLTASATSLLSTTFERRILARDSERRINDSSCLGVAVIVLLPWPSFLISIQVIIIVFFYFKKRHAEREIINKKNKTKICTDVAVNQIFRGNVTQHRLDLFTSI